MSPESESSYLSSTSGAPAETVGAGRYVVMGSLGAGSQGETLDAVDKREGRPVAIKRFSLRGAKSWKGVELAEREATVLASLHHPGLPRYIEHFEEDGALYLVMEKVEGETLAARRKRGQTLTVDQVVRFLSDAAACLRYLHGHAPPIVHRDIKPGNVILRPDGSYCIVDFGSVRDRLKPEGGSTVVGTFGYMAPEQFQGRAAPGSDVYAVAATALSLLTGREPEDLPHQGLAIDVEGALRGQVDRRLLVALRGMLEPDPDRRTPSVDLALRSSGLLNAPAPAGSARATKEARRARWQGDDARHLSDELERRYRKAAKKQARRAEREARRHWRHPHRPVPPGIVLGVVILVALRVASVATFALFGVLLPLLFTIIAVPGRRERMLEIGDAGQRGLARARQHIRYQFLGGPVPEEVTRFLDAMENSEIARHVDAEPPRRKRVSIDVDAEELEAEEEADEAARDARRR